MSNKTLYDILGVQPTASTKEIQKAYRGLSKRLHPDVNDASDAAEQFAELKEAYEVLGSEEWRAKYDEKLKSGEGSLRDPATFHDAFAAFFGRERGDSRPIRGEDIEMTLEVKAADILRSAVQKVKLTRSVTCETCIGSGRVEQKGKCKTCAGKGGTMIEKRTPFGSLKTRQECPDCNGTGKETSAECPDCSGRGMISKSEPFEFELSPLSRFGKSLVFKHKGQAGIDGGETGDLRILLKQAAFDPLAVKYDVDLHERKRIPLHTVLLGNPYEIRFPDGELTEIELAEQLNNGNTLVFPERGLCDDTGKRGFYNLEVVVDFPELTRFQRNAMLSVLEEK